MTIKQGLYRHFKGNYYQVVDVVRDSEQLEFMVLYRALYGDKELWVRPLDMFKEVIERDGKQQARFQYCEQQTQVLEVATFDIHLGQEANFEHTFKTAQSFISEQQGYISHNLKRCIEHSNRYTLFVEWQTLEDHIDGFRQSQHYQQWKKLMQPFFMSNTSVLHYELIV